MHRTKNSPDTITAEVNSGWISAYGWLQIFQHKQLPRYLWTNDSQYLWTNNSESFSFNDFLM